MSAELLLLQLQVSAAVILILILRQGMKRLPKIYSYLLWILVFGRLLCPTVLESNLGIMPSPEEISNWIEKKFSESEGGIVFHEMEKNIWIWNSGRDKGIRINDMNSAVIHNGAEKLVQNGLTALEQGRETFGAGLEEGLKIWEGNFRTSPFWSKNILIDQGETFRIWNFRGIGMPFLLWAAGAAAVLSYNAISLLRVRRRLKSSGQLKQMGEILETLKTLEIWKAQKQKLFQGSDRGMDFLGSNVHMCEDISVPFTMGIFHPKIYLPKIIKDAELEYVLCHEGVHVRRRDYLIKDIAFFLTAINWFNPFIWAAFHFMESDMEMSCDESVVRLMGTDIKKQYSQSLLNFAVKRGQMAVTPLTFGESGVKGRIKNVLTHKKAGKWSFVLGIAIFFGVGTALFTTRVKGAQENDAEENYFQQNDEDVNGGNVKENDHVEIESQGQIYWSGELSAYGRGQAPENAAVKICEDGIYKRDGEGWNCLYYGYISPDVRWCDNEGILYFTMDADYGKNDEEYLVDRVYMLDLNTGTLDDEALRIDESQVREKDIYALDIAGGFVILYRSKSDVVIPLVNMGNSPLTKGHIWKDKAVTELNEAEINAYGAAVREHLLSNPGLLLEISNRSLEETCAFLDMDGDGRTERIVLSADPEKEQGYRPYDNCQFQVGGSRLTGQVGNLSNYIWAFSPDGIRIVLALYSDGVSWNPRTILFTYENGELREIGSFAYDIRNCNITNERIEVCTVLYDAMMPFYIKERYYINREGMLEVVSQEVYDLISAKGRLLANLPVHDSPDSDNDVYVMEPQEVSFIKIDSSYQWICIKGENGYEGWFKVDGEKRSRISELDIDYSEVFELYYAG